ncbi:MAG: hypothetical protein QF486_01520 [Candidatus Woesearchaeota archaeon]|jgi:hypothetical protein|nr:hypothetical protein [Candidatus Woesearchaeota archaeon]MDP7198272.1 hypothetical protein [Candidatus Woesearchaeota archaeon]MDP7467374.1 hypothetical protein [Candidatus Woesearchaeota archaeon]MDP7647601.1 hypothetical protein [Candidatus Woesearchaeota archaeon]
MTIIETLQGAYNNVQNVGLTAIVAATIAASDVQANVFPMPKEPHVPIELTPDQVYNIVNTDLNITLGTTYIVQGAVALAAVAAVGYAIQAYQNQEGA